MNLLKLITYKIECSKCQAMFDIDSPNIKNWKCSWCKGKEGFIYIGHWKPFRKVKGRE